MILFMQQEKLEGSSNYPTWKFGTMMQLIKEDLWELIDSEDLNLNDAKIKKRDQRALASIRLGLTPQLFVLVADCVTAKEAWDKLEKNFQSAGVIQKVTLRRELLRTRFEDFKCMEDYLNRMYSLARELQTVQAPVPDEDLAIMILANLPSSYDTLIITMKNSRNELNLDEVRCKLIQEEARRNLNDSENNENSALKVTSSKKRDFSTYKCYNCNEYGHIARYCRKRRRGERRAHFHVHAMVHLLTQNSGKNVKLA
ncbi:hypothetical protein B566_EDAN017954 [Ephemera danica]|nr:hypothetical protein B566_EDAN017954 [Ephemera danica]